MSPNNCMLSNTSKAGAADAEHRAIRLHAVPDA